MIPENSSLSHPTHKIGDVRSAWEANAAFWDAYMGDRGNDFQRELVGIPTERLMEIKPGETILDVACGSGIFARRMAELGANIVGFDFCAAFLACAIERSLHLADRIQYLELDAANYDALVALGEGRFDGAVCTMALMDMEEIAPLAWALPRLLKPGGRFVFSVCHPSFNSADPAMVAEQHNDENGLVTEFSVKVKRYIEPYSFRGIGIRGQPEMHPYFHRPLTLLLRPFFEAGLVLDALEEPVFGPNPQESGTLTWTNYHDIPPALIARLRARS